MVLVIVDVVAVVVVVVVMVDVVVITWYTQSKNCKKIGEVSLWLVLPIRSSNLCPKEHLIYQINLLSI